MPITKLIDDAVGHRIYTTGYYRVLIRSQVFFKADRLRVVVEEGACDNKVRREIGPHKQPLNTPANCYWCHDDDDWPYSSTQSSREIDVEYKIVVHPLVSGSQNKKFEPCQGPHSQIKYAIAEPDHPSLVPTLTICRMPGNYGEKLTISEPKTQPKLSKQ